MATMMKRGWVDIATLSVATGELTRYYDLVRLGLIDVDTHIGFVPPPSISAPVALGLQTPYNPCEGEEKAELKKAAFWEVSVPLAFSMGDPDAAAIALGFGLHTLYTTNWEYRDMQYENGCHP